MKPLRIFIDMDNVLVDFDPGACKAHGVPYEKMAARRGLGEWGLSNALGLNDVTEFWPPIDAAGSRFWEELAPLPWARDLIELVKRFTNEWYIATSPSYHPSSYHGKAVWLKEFFGDPKFDSFNPTPHKHLLAQGPHCLLIDDRMSTCQHFVAQGGLAICFPSHGNELWEMRHNPLPFVEHRLSIIHRSTRSLIDARNLP